MAAFIVGTKSMFTSANTVDSLLPVTRVASKTLVPGIDQLVQGDPAAGNLVFSLPDGTTSNGISFLLKRINSASNNIVTLLPVGGDSIDGGTAGFVLGNVNEWVEVYSDGTPIWRRRNGRTFAIGSLATNGSGTFSLTTGFTKLTTWNDNGFSTAGRIIADHTTDQLKVLNFQGPLFDGYDISLQLSIEFNVNKIVTAQMFANGALVGFPSSVNAAGSGKPVTIYINSPIGITSTTDIEVHVKGESAGTLTVLPSVVVASRIGG